VKEDFMDTLLFVGLSNALAATVLALVAAVVGRLWRRPAFTHALWLLVLLKLLTPPLFVVPVSWPALADPAPVSVAAGDMGDDSPWLASQATDLTEEPEGDGMATAPAENQPKQNVAGAGPGARLVVGAGWLLGSVLWWTIAAGRVARLQRLVRHAQPAALILQERARNLADRLELKRCPAVRLVPGAVSPLVCAFGRWRCLLLPAALWDGLSEEQRDALLVHELAHLRRGDHWVRCLELVVTGLYWWHPIVWWARRELREAEEQCCDAWVVWALPHSAEAYATALVDTAAFLSRAMLALPPAASGMGQTYHLKRRVTMIMCGTTRRSLSRIGIGAMLVLATLLLPWVPGWAQTNGQPAAVADEEEPPAPSPAAPRPAVPPHVISSPPRPAAPTEERSEQQQELRDDIELLRVQHEVLEADLAETKVHVQKAQRHLATIQSLRKQNIGAVSNEDLDQAKSDLEVQEARLRGKELKVREAELRIRQVQRRLASLQRRTDRPAIQDSLNPSPAAEPKPAPLPAPVWDGPGRPPIADVHATPTAGPSSEQRLRKLEDKLDTLLKEVDGLRRELRPKKTKLHLTWPPEKPDHGITVHTRNLRIPVDVDPNRCRDLKRLILYVSTDLGVTWESAATIAPTADAFTFYAPRDGVYWFAVSTVDREGKAPNTQLINQQPALKVLIKVGDSEDRSGTDRHLPREKPPARVGQITIVGNETVAADVILRQVPLLPGAVLNYPDLRTAERNLARLGLFMVDPQKGIRPTVTVVDAEDDKPFKDILITVKEVNKAKGNKH
jgi:beta-lactamase regulating signal transducer with metallopeptidase domain